MTFYMIPQKYEVRECQSVRTSERQNTRKQDNERNSRKKVESSQRYISIAVRIQDRRKAIAADRHNKRPPHSKYMAVQGRTNARMRERKYTSSGFHPPSFHTTIISPRRYY